IKKGVLADYGAGATLENVHLWATVDFTGATGAVRLGGFFGTVGDGDLSFEECSVNGSMTHNPDTALKQEHTVGCFIGYVPAAVYFGNVLFESCTNNMSITDNNGAKVGGIAGYVGSVAATGITVTVKDCLNTGNMAVTMDNSSDKNLGSFSSFIGCYADAGSNLTMTNCVNKGNVEGSAAYFGGLIGSISKAGVVQVKGCANYGNVKADATLKGRAGGIVGRLSVAADYIANTIVTKCVNYGYVEGNTRVGGIGVSGSDNLQVTDCVNVGEVVNTYLYNSAATPNTGRTDYLDAIWNTTAKVVITNCATLQRAKYLLEGEPVTEDLAPKPTIDAGEEFISQTNVGAGVRIVNDTAGTALRFKITMDTATVNALTLLKAEAGVVILQTNLLEQGKDLTAENYTNAVVVNGNASEIANGYYYASVTALQAADYETAYSCRSFWRYKTSADGEWITVYADQTESRTVKDVATAALAAIENGQDTNHYTEEQITLLKTYAGVNS
ncbi:MAG: hypothetical protein IKA44_07210, partial [Clostridia bacterium]|nr:hypothetical protein [Clostridia bacterium]